MADDQRPVITLLTDFGLGDTYVGQMKGVIARLAPTATVIDLTHAVMPQAVEQGAFLLQGAVDAFPPHAIHVAVVDPGVGTARAALAIRTPHGVFVGPDNGLLSCILPDATRPTPAETVGPPDESIVAAAGDEQQNPAAAPFQTAVVVPVRDTCTAVALHIGPGQPPSPTFHGRDLFAVAAARIAIGEPVERLGARVTHLLALPAFAGVRGADGAVLGRVLHIDRFGNLITSIHRCDLPERVASVTVGSASISTFVRTYAEGTGLVALIGSSNYLEIAEVNGSAAARVGVGLGARVRLA